MWEKSYGLKDGAPVSLEHIVALLFYTNFTENSFMFSKTYRKAGPFESDRLLKRRHSIWGRLLRVLVECFGEITGHNRHIKVFYHGINASMIFNGTSIKLFGPVSTTLSTFVCSLFAFHLFLLFVRRVDDCNLVWILGHCGGDTWRCRMHVLFRLPMVVRLQPRG